jgi:hypothetical protein
MKTTIPALVGLLTLAATLTAGSAVAAEQCKGLAQDICAVDSACSWVDSYTRKDGRTVNGHCKSRPAGKTDGSADVEAPKVGQAG